MRRLLKWSLVIDKDPHHVAAHSRLAHQSRVVLNLGLNMLAAGASSFRVKDGMARLARAVGIEEHHAQVTYTEIATTAYANGTFRTELAEQRVMGVNADRIDRFGTFVANLPEHLLVEDAEAAIDKIVARKPLYSTRISALASGVACAGFAFLNQGGPVECASVFLAAMLGQALRKRLMSRRMNHFGVWMVCGMFAVATYMLAIGSLGAAGVIDASHEAGVVSAVLFLVPGFPLVTSILDLIRQDFSAGISRGVYVVMLVISTAVAIWTMTNVLHWSVEPSEPGYSLAPVVLFFARAAATFIASYGFAMLFNTPWQAATVAAAIGAIINTSRLTAQDSGMIPLAAVGCAALVVGLLAHLGSILTRFSRVTLSVPAVVVMIPGVPLYRAITALNNGEVLNSLSSMLTVITVITSIGVGLAVARMITDRSWLMEARHDLPRLPGSEATIPESFRSR